MLGVCGGSGLRRKLRRNIETGLDTRSEQSMEIECL